MRTVRSSIYTRIARLAFAPLLALAGLMLAGCDSRDLTQPAVAKPDAVVMLRVDAQYAVAPYTPGWVVLHGVESSGQILRTQRGEELGLRLLNASTTPQAVSGVLRRLHTPDPSRRIAMDAEYACPLRPGTYAIMDLQTDRLVGILIVYPDCRMEVVPVTI